MPHCLDPRTFCLAVAKGLATGWESMGCTLRDAGASPNKRMKGGPRQVRVHLKPTDLLAERFDPIHGHSQFCAKLPEKRDNKQKVKVNKQSCKVYPSHRLLVCRYCSEVNGKITKTSWWCTKCEKPLCKSLCFQLWHQKPSLVL